MEDAITAVRLFNRFYTRRVGALRSALAGPGASLVVASDVRVARPGSPDEAAGADAAGALLVGDDANAPVLAEVIGSAQVYPNGAPDNEMKKIELCMSQGVSG